MEIPILYQDQDILVCVKSAGVLSEKGGLPELLREQRGGEIYCVHRLDRAVGGVLVYARTSTAAAKLSAAVAGRQMDKQYLAVVSGRPELEAAELRDLLYHDPARNKSYVVRRARRGVREAASHYTLLDTAAYGPDTVSLLRIRLLTGRSHQIRVQFASRGMPLLGDGRYGSRYREEHLALWSWQLCFSHPAMGAAMQFRCPPPEELPWTLFPALFNGSAACQQAESVISCSQSFF